MALKHYPVGDIPIVRSELIVNTILVTLATTSVIFRILGRKTRKVHLWWDDYTIILCLLCVFSMLAIQVADIIFGMRIHVERLPTENLATLLRMLVAYQILYGTAQSLAKFSYLFFYLRIFINKGFIFAVEIMIGIVIAWWTANVLQVFLICRPFNMNWNVNVEGVCGDRPAAYTAFGAINLITDVAILLLPIPTVWKLKMPVSSKVGICAIFAIGLVICIISIIRMQSLITLDFSDISYNMLNPVFWTVTEPSLAIINACLPIMRHLMKHLFGQRSWVGSNVRTKGASGSNTFERMQDGELPLTNLHDKQQGTTTSIIKAPASANSSREIIHPSTHENDDNSSEGNVEIQPRNTIQVTTQWKISS